MEYYLALKRNELSRHVKTQVNLKYMLVSKRNQAEKTTALFHLYDILQKAKS